MDTLRKWLDEAKVDWKSLIIIAHTIQDDDSPGWAKGYQSFKFDFSKGLPDEQINKLLDIEFYSGYGGPGAPRFIAKDKDRIYFPVQYDGATWLESIYIDIEKYMDVRNQTPYPGGG